MSKETTVNPQETNGKGSSEEQDEISSSKEANNEDEKAPGKKKNVVEQLLDRVGQFFEKNTSDKNTTVKDSQIKSPLKLPKKWFPPQKTPQKKGLLQEKETNTPLQLNRSMSATSATDIASKDDFTNEQSSIASSPSPLRKGDRPRWKSPSEEGDNPLSTVSPEGPVLMRRRSLDGLNSTHEKLVYSPQGRYSNPLSPITHVESHNTDSSVESSEENNTHSPTSGKHQAKIVTEKEKRKLDFSHS